MQPQEKAQLVAGYTTTAGLASTPIWLTEMVSYFHVGAALMAFLVGLTTLYLNILKIRKVRKELKE